MTTSTEPSRPTLLLVAGAGRSGTSTVSGSLSRLGFSVPQPEVPADDTNPRGFYEPQWVVDFHRRILDEIKIRTHDSRPTAVDMAAETSNRADLVEELTAWLEPQAAAGRVVVKDPRIFWMHDLWRRAADNLGLDLVFLTMLRPPAEVARSRDQHYLAGKDDEFRRARETTSVASWCHGILVTERATRHDRRAFVRYHDLMTDWRTALRRADESLGTGVMDSVSDEHHPIDEFIDPRLNRSQVEWSDLKVHAQLTEIADQVWAAASQLVDDPSDAAATAELDALHERYDQLYTFAEDLTFDTLRLQREMSRERRDALKNKQRQRVREFQAQIRRLETINAELRSGTAQPRRSLVGRVARRIRRQ